MKICRKIFVWVGIFPIRDHYYEPMFNLNHLRHPLSDNRNLPGIDFNIDEQLKILNSFSFNEELLKFPTDKTNNQGFYYCNGSFESGDAEYLYNIIRFFKPKRIVEIGSGYSTLIAVASIRQNMVEDHTYHCEHICIEPYENNWLETISTIKIIREKVEDVDKNIFEKLDKNDILFIDSSHIIRPQGDVLFEYLEILPTLKKGVLVHIHDIFTPKDYLDEWIVNENRFWNEQYLLEAFLAQNNQYKIIGALNYLKHNYFAQLSDKCPILQKEKNREPGSFWIIRC